MKQQRPDKVVKVRFMDEARFGQKGTMTKMWAPTGSRPAVIRQTKYEWAYLYAAVDPESGESSALLARHVNTETMNAFLRIVSDELAPNEHVVMIMDRAGWHVSGGLAVPENITILLLPPYSPELNPVERLWLYLKSHFLSNRVFADYDHLLQVGGDAYRAVEPQRQLLTSICAAPWLRPGSQA